MAEILIKAVAATHSNPKKDRHCYKRGMPVIVMPDGHKWGSSEGLPKFVVIKIPGITRAKIRKYTAEHHAHDPEFNVVRMYRRRIWKIRWADLPQGAKDKLKNNGELIIKAGSYTGSYDYTWQQVKNFFWDLKNDVGETEDL